jgi:hypothetical protein
MKSTSGEPLYRIGTSVDCDGLVAAYSQEADDEQSEGLAGRLITECAAPTIRKIVRAKLGFRGNRSIVGYTAQEVEELCSEAVLQVLSWLKDFKSRREQRTVNNFPGLVAVIAFRACSGYMRELDPGRASFVRKIRYCLDSNPDFDIWRNDDNEWICGLAKWRAERKTRTSPSSGDKPGQRYGSDSGSNDRFFQFRQALPAQAEGSISGVPDLVSAIFDWAGSPMRLDELIDIASKWRRTKDASGPTSPLAGVANVGAECIADPGVDIANRLEEREYLRQTWGEIVKLPARQRLALLLNLRDPEGEGAISLLPFLGIVSFEELAGTLSMSTEELVDIWQVLPLNDEQIAVRLGASRQQVVNLRRSARDRLQRRLRFLGVEP